MPRRNSSRLEFGADWYELLTYWQYTYHPPLCQSAGPRGRAESIRRCHQEKELADMLPAAAP